MANVEFVSPSEIQKAAEKPVDKINHEAFTELMKTSPKQAFESLKQPQDNGGTNSAHGFLPNCVIDHGNSNSGSDSNSGGHKPSK